MRILAASTLALTLLLGACSKQDVETPANTDKAPVAEVQAPTPQPASAAAGVDEPAVKEAIATKALDKVAKPVVKAAADEHADHGHPFVEEPLVMAKYQLGKHYDELPQKVKTITGDKIEVTELFSYACVHCFHFESIAKQWAKSKPEGVEFVQNPAVFNAVWEYYARLFYTAKSLGVLDQLHMEFFKAMHVQRKRLREEDEVAAIFAKAGIDKETYKSTFDSFGVSSQVQLADSRARSFGTSGTPELIVNGRYRVTSSKAGSHQEMFAVTNFLIDKIKREEGKK